MKTMKEEPCKEIYKKKISTAAASESSKEDTDNFNKILDTDIDASELSATAGSQMVDSYDGDSSPNFSLLAPGYEDVEGCNNDKQDYKLLEENVDKAVGKTQPKPTAAAAKNCKKADKIEYKLSQRKTETTGKEADEIDNKLLQEKYGAAGKSHPQATSALLVQKEEDTESEYKEESISYSLENYSEDVQNYDDDENALKLLQEKYEAAGKSPSPPSASDLFVSRRPSIPQYALNNYDEDIEYSDEEDITSLREEKYKFSKDKTYHKHCDDDDEAVHRESTNESSGDDSQQSLTSLPEYAINVEQMDDDDDNLLYQKYQRFERPLPDNNFTRKTSQNDIPISTGSDNMKFPGAIAVGADKKPSYRSQEAIMNDSAVSLTYEDEEYNIVNSSNLSVDGQNSHSVAQSGLTRQQSVAMLVDEELEFETLDRRVEEVLKTATLATAEEIDLNGRRRLLCCVGSVVVMFVVAGVVLVAIFTRNSTDTNMVDFQSRPTPSPINTQKPTIDTVVERGVLRCVVPNQAPGFAKTNSTTGKHEGFEVDSCRAVAAATMGATYDIEIVGMSWNEGFFALANGSVDLIARGVTHTMERDVYKSDTRTGFSFTVPYLYVGLGFGGKPSFVECADNIQAYGNCSELKICVLEKSTHFKILEDLFPRGSLLTSLRSAGLREMLINGLCNVIAHEKTVISEELVRDQGYIGEYSVGKTLLSKEPLAIVTRADDYKWSQIVNWVLQAQFLAEAMDITQDTADNFSKISPFGDKYNGMFVNAISAVGNYGERYERYLEKVLPRGGLNMLHLNENQLNEDSHISGLIYSYPFGPIDKDGPGPTAGSRLNTIAERGVLRCGITQLRDGFAMVDTERLEWHGLDIDYCKAVAASIFGSTIDSSIEYITLTHKNLFDALITDDVDLVCGANIDIDANIEMGISFSQPYFYEGKFKSRSLATYGKEDSQFSDFVFWVVCSTFYAEEKNITSSSIFNAMPEVRTFGPQHYEMFRDVILVTGNYGDMYKRNLQSIIPRSGRNNLNSPMIGPQINPYVGF